MFCFQFWVLAHVALATIHTIPVPQQAPNSKHHLVPTDHPIKGLVTMLSDWG